MLCQKCGKNEANIRYTQIINGVKKEVALCSKCASELGLENIDLPINFTSFLGDFFNDFAQREFLPNMSINEVKCKKCGMTYDDFINTGLFGCSDCYDEFSTPIDSLLKNLHGTAKHIGRGPKNITSGKSDSKYENDNSNDRNSDYKYDGKKINSKNEIINDKEESNILEDLENNNKTDEENTKLDKMQYKVDKKNQLEQDLAKAIKEERYEDAAKIRDELKEMNK